MRSWKEKEFKIGHRRQRDKFPALIVLEYEKIVLQAKGQRPSKSVSFPKLVDHQHRIYRIHPLHPRGRVPSVKVHVTIGYPRASVQEQVALHTWYMP